MISKLYIGPKEKIICRYSVIICYQKLEESY